MHSPGRVALASALTLIAVIVAPAAARAEHASAPVRLFRIGTGGERGTYYPIGTMIAQALSATRDNCKKPTECGIPGLLAVAQLSNGSVSNVDSLRAGVLEAALVQADVAQAAYSGTGPFAGRPPQTGLRAIANLYKEEVHVVARAGTGMRTLADLRGRRVSLDEPGSGTLVTVRRVLGAYGLSETALKPIYIKPQFAAEKLLAGDLDAFFIVAGAPTPSVADLAAHGGATLLPVSGPRVDALLAKDPLLTHSVIPAGTYAGIAATPTVAVGAQLLVRADLDAKLVYEVTRILFSPRTRAMLAVTHIRGGEIRTAALPAGMKIPLHPGAARYYRERRASGQGG